VVFDAHQAYRAMENVIAGLVITFSEITEQKKAQDRLSVAHNYIQNVVSAVREPMVVLDETFRVVSASRAFFRIFKLTPETSQGQSIYEIANRQWDIQPMRELLEHIMVENETFEDYRVEHDFASLGRRIFMLNARRMCSLDEGSCSILLAFEEVTGGAE
jgi:two-component system CheB/CheR fusion protein